MAALWPGIPLTPPPRLAPAPHSRIAGCSVSTPQRPDLALVLGERPREITVEDVPAGHSQLLLEIHGAVHLQAGPPVRCERAGTSSSGSASTLSSERIVASSAASRARAGSAANRRAGMCSTNTVSVCAPASRSSEPRMPGSVSEWQYASHGGASGIAPAAACAYASRSCAAVSLTWNVPAKARSGSIASSLQPRQPRQQEVQLQLCALRPLACRRGAAEQPVELRRGRVDQDVPARARCARRVRR